MIVSWLLHWASTEWLYFSNVFCLSLIRKIHGMYCRQPCPFSLFSMCFLLFVLLLLFYRQLKIEGNTVLYISKLSSTFFYGLIESAEEFKKAFTENNDSASGKIFFGPGPCILFLSGLWKIVLHMWILIKVLVNGLFMMDCGSRRWEAVCSCKLRLFLGSNLFSVPIFSYGCVSSIGFTAFVVWCLEELSGFVQRFSSQVFGGGNNLTVVADCIQTACNYCDKVNDYLNVSSLLECMLA